ncbi:hypothetical protein PIROE2DRAFT_2019 [Piromyces sp. E2]|nr:hypothetical protein PIROE2DRAFT_2019 [Piromyces sp. E2]|eukprot:OUM70059.1 hypothetical protein PIROE2DRAFT_2019 [Piromyces sp. E2]
MKDRHGYKLDSSVARAIKIANKNCPKFYPCCKKNIGNDNENDLNNSIHLEENSEPNIIQITLLVSVQVNYSVINNSVYNNSSMFSKIFNFLSRKRNNNNTKEWKELYKCQTNVGLFSDIPFLLVTATLLNNIISIAIGRQRPLFDKFKPDNTKSVNADIIVRQISRVSATHEMI